MSIGSLSDNGAWIKGDYVLGNTDAEKNPQQKLVRQYEEAVDRGDVEALFALAAIYMDGREGFPYDPETAVKLYEKAALWGNARAMFYLGLAQESAYTEDKVYHDDLAAEWYRKAVEGGDVDAMVNLGVLYEEGRGVPCKNEIEAVRLYREAANHGNTDAKVALGVMHEEGRGGLVQDGAAALQLYSEAEKEGSLLAAVRLGMMYEEGRCGVEKDLLQAIMLYNKVAKKREVEAQVKQHNLCREAFSDTTEDELVTMARRAGAEAMVILGGCRRDGFWRRRDECEELHWHLLAASRGHTGAMYRLGTLYQGGRIVPLPEPEVEAVRWLKLAAEAGDHNAMFLLAEGYYYGKDAGTLKLAENGAEAVRLYKLAVGRGNLHAMEKLAQMYLGEGKPFVPKDLVEAVRLFKMAFQYGSSRAAAALSMMYQRGVGGLPKDEREAHRLWQLAAQNRYFF